MGPELISLNYVQRVAICAFLRSLHALSGRMPTAPTIDVPCVCSLLGAVTSARERVCGREVCSELKESEGGRGLL